MVIIKLVGCTGCPEYLDIFSMDWNINRILPLNLLSFFYGFVGGGNVSLRFEDWLQGRTLMFVVALLSFDIRDSTVRTIGNVRLPEKYTTLIISVCNIPGKNGGLTYHSTDHKFSDPIMGAA